MIPRTACTKEPNVDCTRTGSARLLTTLRRLRHLHRGRTIATWLVALALLLAGAAAGAQELAPPGTTSPDDPINDVLVPSTPLRVGLISDGLLVSRLGLDEAVADALADAGGARYSVKVVRLTPEALASRTRGTELGATETSDVAETSDIAGIVDAALADPSLDAVVVLGPDSTRRVCSQAGPEGPVVAALVPTPDDIGCETRPGLAIIHLPIDELIARDLGALARLMRRDRLEHPVMIADAGLLTHLDRIRLDERLAADGLDLEIVGLDGSQEPASVIAAIREAAPDADAVYLAPIDLGRTSSPARAGIATLAELLASTGLPSFSMIGEAEVEQGILAGIGARSSMKPLARACALDVLDLVDGIPIGPARRSIPSGTLTINMATARRLSLSPSWEVLAEARLIHQDPRQSGRPIRLEQVAARALQANLDLAVAERRVLAGQQDVTTARSTFLPHLEADLAGLASDEGHALAALGQYARMAAGSLTLTQLIWADDASANLEIQQQIQQAREADREALRLDIVRTATRAYLDLLRAGALVQVRRDEVGLDRTNLDLARVRRSLGSAAATETLRWQAELATAEAALLESMALERQAGRQLSRLLDEPLTTTWSVEPPELNEALELLDATSAGRRLDSPRGLDELGRQLRKDALGRAPELAALDAALAAQQRALTAARRAAYVPEVGLKVELRQILAKDESLGVQLGPLGDMLPAFPDSSWNAAVSARLPVLTGGARPARVAKAREELRRLELDRRSAASKLDQRLLSALDQAAASWSAIALRREAAEAAGQGRALVADAYSRGAASLLELLDAQHTSLAARIAAVSSVYDFLDDWAEVRRATAEGP